MAKPTPILPYFHTSALLAAAALSVAIALPAARAQTRSEFVPTFSTNTRVKQQVERLQRLATQKLWDEWLAAYQGLVDDDRDLVLTRDDEFLIGLRERCHELFAALPAPVKQRYHALYDAESKRLYDKAAAGRDEAVMRDLYSRFRFTATGPRALQWLADQALDEGRSEMARTAYSRLAKDPAVTAPILLRWALAADAAGQPQEAKAVLDRVRKEMGAQPVQLAGQQTAATAAADVLARSFKPAAGPAAGTWPAFGGENGDRKMRGAVSGGLKRLWEYPLPAMAAGTSGTAYGRSIVVSSRARFNFLTFPVVQGDRIYVQGGRATTALKLDAGLSAWEQQDQVLTRDEIPNDNTNPRLGGRYPTSGRPVQVMPCLDGKVLVVRAPMATGDRDTSRWPADYSLCGYDARTGRQLWRRLAGGDPRGVFFNLPTLQGNVVFTGVATYKGGITEYSAVALDAATGDPIWTTYLGAGSDPLDLVDGSPPAIRDGLVWVESSLYTLNALDLVTGEIRWIYHYSPSRRGTFAGGFNSTPSVTNEPVSLIGLGSRRKVDGKVVAPILFAPRWGGKAVMIDGDTGSLRWESAKAENEKEAGWLFGVDGTHAYTCGTDGIRAINIGDDAKSIPPGLRDWDWSMEGSGYLGYPALAGDRIYVPIEGRVLVLSAADKKLLETLDISEGVGDNPGVVTVSIVDGKLLATTQTRIVAFGPK